MEPSAETHRRNSPSSTDCRSQSEWHSSRQRSPRHRDAQPLQTRGHSEQRRAHQPLPTPLPSRKSVPGRCSSIAHTGWAQGPTRSRSQTTSVPRRPDASTSSLPFPSHPKSRIPAVVGSTHSTNSRHFTRTRGSRIYDTIDAAHTPTQRATLAKRLDKLVHAPDALKSTARHLELELHVPDCTGGGQ